METTVLEFITNSNYCHSHRRIRQLTVFLGARSRYRLCSERVPRSFPSSQSSVTAEVTPYHLTLRDTWWFSVPHQVGSSAGAIRRLLFAAQRQRQRRPGSSSHRRIRRRHNATAIVFIVTVTDLPLSTSRRRSVERMTFLSSEICRLNLYQVVAAVIAIITVNVVR